MITYPTTKEVEVDVIAQDGAVPVSCKVIDGKIVPALAAVEKGTAPENALFAAYSAGCDIFTAVCGDGIYESASGKTFYKTSETACDTPVIFEGYYEDTPHAIVFGNAYCYLSDGDSHTSVLHGGKQLSCGIMHCGRLFGADAADGFMLRWSGEGGIVDWYQNITGSGWAKLSPECGKILNLVPYENNIAAVREHGISEITANGTPENFKISSKINFTGGVYANTAALISGDIYFYTKSGLCKYSGDITGVTHNLESEISSPFCHAAYGGNYFLGAYSKTLDKNAVFVYDTADKYAYLIDVTPKAICAGNEILIIGDALTYDLRTAESFIFKSGNFNFGTPYKKVLNAVMVDSDGGCDITVSNGDISRIFTDVSGSVRLNMNGRTFSVTIVGTKKIRSVTARAEVIDGI